jgi:GNAT superfamily N-acetyltransferase
MNSVTRDGIMWRNSRAMTAGISMALSIRPATASDAEAVADMGREFVDYLRALGDAKAHSLTADEYLRDGFGDDPAFTGLIAELDEVSVGYLLYTPGYDLDRGGRFLYVVELFVQARSRRAGVGRALFEAAADIGRRRGWDQMSWSVYSPNAPARAFYEEVGAGYTRNMRVMYLAL